MTSAASGTAQAAETGIGEAPFEVRTGIAQKNYAAAAFASFVVVALGIVSLGHAWQKHPPPPSYTDGIIPPKPRDATPFILVSCAIWAVVLVLGGVLQT